METAIMGLCKVWGFGFGTNEQEHGNNYIGLIQSLGSRV